MSGESLSMGSLSAVLLAAGSSRRSLNGNKLLLPGPFGRPVVRQVAKIFCGLGLAEVLVVTGHEAERIEAALEGLPLRCVFAEEHALGMGHSLAAGVRATIRGAGGFLITPCDLPWLTRESVVQVSRAFLEREGQHHVIPLCAGQRGHPVALAASLRDALEGLRGDQGARGLLAEPGELARTDFLDVSSTGIHVDNDDGGARG